MRAAPRAPVRRDVVWGGVAAAAPRTAEGGRGPSAGPGLSGAAAATAAAASGWRRASGPAGAALGEELRRRGDEGPAG